MAAKVFIAQPAIDGWVSGDQVELQGDTLVFLADGRRLKLVPGTFFVTVSDGGPDPHGLVGKVKDQDEMTRLGAEQYMTSVILGDTAYDVEPGFVGTPVDPARDGGEPLRQALQAVSR